MMVIGARRLRRWLVVLCCGGLLPQCNSANPAGDCVNNSACAEGFLCQAGTCMQACIDTPSCGEGSYCLEGVCQTFECLSDSDCQADTFTCTDVELTSNCQGQRSVGRCLEHTCLKLDDDSACADVLHACPDNFKAVPCTSSANQAPPVCPTQCSGDADCLAGYGCTLGACSSGTGQPPVLVPAPDQALRVGVAMTPLNLAGYTITTDGDAILGYELLSGSLPTGLTLLTDTGVISGTPTAVGTSAITWSARDKDGTQASGDSCQFTVTAPATPPQLSTAPNQSLTLGTLYASSLAPYVTATDGDFITGYVLLGGTLPPGITFNTSSGLLSGTPTGLGVFTITWTAADKDGQNSTGSALQLTVNTGTPVIIYSDSLGGAAMTSIPRGAYLYGRVLALGPNNVQACVEVMGVSDGACAAPPSGWTSLPNADWSYDSLSGEWRAQIAPCTFPVNNYRQFARDANTGAQSNLVFALIETCRWMAQSFPCGATPTSSCDVANVNATLTWDGSPWKCTCLCY